jgi:hypothetical protein
LQLAHITSPVDARTLTLGLTQKQLHRLGEIV